MELSITQQAMSLLYFSALGLALGLLYDLLRQLRYSWGMAILWDGLFCSLAAAGCFVLSMAQGKLGIWDILLTLALFCLYINYISGYVFPIIAHIFGLFSGFVRFLVKKYFFLKKFFSNRKD